MPLLLLYADAVKTELEIGLYLIGFFSDKFKFLLRSNSCGRSFFVSPNRCPHTCTCQTDFSAIFRIRGHGFELPRCSHNLYRRSFVSNCL